MKKIVFITGTNSGFCKLMVITLSKAGHRVIAGMRDSNGRNKAVAKN
jgi:NAD(P)-dependent dehydrogenase (short-subunit alcohol dehydrogenase family)